MQNKQDRFFKWQRQCLLPLLLFLAPVYFSQSIANYISNGGFEENYNNCAGPGYPLMVAKSWLSIDSISFGGVYFSYCNNKVPKSINTYQYPHSGSSHIITNFYCPFCGIRGYPKNRLKKRLEAGKTYCVKYYVNISNSSPFGMDGFGAYFGDGSIDTISKCTIPLTYITPQVKNPLGNVIKDTLNWVPITGTFVANGTEKYALLGNFMADNAVTTASIGGQYYPQQWTDLLVDDVSCIDVDLPAFAGPDLSIAPGDSAFIGRQPDVGIDEACRWYKLPASITPTTPALDTVAGLYVKPVVTSTYVVRQQLWCSGVKWDTVVVYMNLTGVEKRNALNDELKIWPVPATDKLHLQVKGAGLWTLGFELEIRNALGQVIKRVENVSLNGSGIEIETAGLPEGVYTLLLKSGSSETVSRRFILSR